MKARQCSASASLRGRPRAVDRFLHKRVRPRKARQAGGSAPCSVTRPCRARTATPLRERLCRQPRELEQRPPLMSTWLAGCRLAFRRTVTVQYYS
ncbi:hypothetical protein E2562_004853 [Oryza meyeriana var. granulata]|uniref:Uncharacterized protein n=1 Tax=Oryza meyeriana var. granulata TaxID=110450 RepID=A0A6G1DER2_9ORYZ|nr:hypothetical protein E2562_004853 [Oryza meyeriana var. granulata]